MTKVKSEEKPDYKVTGKSGPKGAAAEAAIIATALEILQRRIESLGDVMDSPDTVRQYAVMKLSALEHEVFRVMFLDNKHRLITCEELFRGTIDGASVHPREVVKAALRHNAAAVILAHNHPSGVPEPSRADIQLTRRLVDALALIDVRILDHLIVGGIETISFAERGLI